jgi:hypothetical protein
VADQSLRSDHHYVPCTYLKRWAASDGRVWTYRTLVSHPHVEPWRLHAPKGIAYHQHLYTRIVGGAETDEFEQWLDREIEMPAGEAIEKVIMGAQLTPDDWKRLIRFLAAQQVRTPRWFAEQVHYWNTGGRRLVKDTLEHSVQQFTEEIVQYGHLLPRSQPVRRSDIPMRITAGLQSEQNILRLRARVEVLFGRAFWVSQMRSVLDGIVRALYQHRWTILLPPKGLTWFTSDDPVVRLRFDSETGLTCDGGWDTPNTTIFMPLGPEHLLYTHIGGRPPRRGERMPHELAMMARHCIAVHGHRLIFAAERDADVPTLRPRQVDAEGYQREQEYWSNWHRQQTAAEQDLSRGTQNG